MLLARASFSIFTSILSFYHTSESPYIPGRFFLPHVRVILYPEPVASLAVVAVAVGDADPDDARDVGEQVGAQLRDAGWRGPDGASADGGPAVGEDDGLPSGGVLVALRQRWEQ